MLLSTVVVGTGTVVYEYVITLDGHGGRKDDVPEAPPVAPGTLE